MKPWTDIGVDISVNDSLSDAMQEAGVTFHVSVRQGYFIEGPHQGKCGDDYKRAEGRFYIVRNDINAVLGSCKTKFQPLQNSDAFDFFRPLLANGTCTLDTIGTFGVGQKVWILAKIHNAISSVVEGDDISLYLILINAHDGSISVMVGIVPIRVVCTNMFNMLNRSEFEIVKFKHTGDPAEKLKQVTDLISTQLRSVDGFAHQLKTLTKKWPTPEDLDKYYRAVFKIKVGASTRAENKITRLKALFIQGQGNQLEAVRGTWYAAYNAASEYLNYEAGRSTETRLNSLWFGAGNTTNDRALTLALEECNALRK